MQPLDLVLRLFVAALCGGAIGLQTELRDRPGGFRTHLLTAVGAATFCGTAASVADSPSDALRVVQGIASGVGFIGAAAVLRDSGRVRGTATAASLWITAAVGCQAGLGDIWIAGGLAVFTTLSNVVAFQIERRLLKWRPLHRRSQDHQT
jgi:putative Mg2+ transporter-C (MgtC) family protein